jgi:C-terminal processing protease CtpA/Prc
MISSFTLQGEFEEVRIKRISTAQIAAKRKIFDNFSHLHDKFKRGRDHEAVRYLQETMDLWEDQLIQQFDHEATVLGTWTTFQKVSTRWTSELAELLETIHTLGSTADEEEDDDDVLQPLPAMLFSKPEKMSNHRSPSKKTHTEAVLLQSCGALCSSLDEHLRVNMANDADNASQSGTKSTLGIKYNPSSLQIEALEVGGPAFNCGKMKKGDVLLKVNDEDVKTNNVERLLRGDDMPGSTLRLELRCAETHQESYVSLTRMPTGVLGDSLSHPPLSPSLCI